MLDIIDYPKNSGTVQHSKRAPPEHEVEEANFLIVCVCVCARTHTHTHIPLIHKCVTKTVGCKTSHNYTNIHNYYSVKHYEHFTKQYYRSSLYIRNSATE